MVELPRARQARVRHELAQLRASNPVVLLSGGIDSYALWVLLGQPQAVYCALGHSYEAAELRAMRHLGLIEGRDYTLDFRLTLSADETNRDGSNHVRFRNLYLAMLASSVSSTVVLGATCGEGSNDKTSYFYRTTSRLLSFIEEDCIRLVAPARHLTKTELVRLLLEHDHRQRLKLASTRSCYYAAPSDIECGDCWPCYWKWVTFSQLGLACQFQRHPTRFFGASRRVQIEHLLRHPISEWRGQWRRILDARRAHRLHRQRKPWRSST